jgi:hypothetical protein
VTLGRDLPALDGLASRTSGVGVRAWEDWLTFLITASSSPELVA